MVVQAKLDSTDKINKLVLNLLPVTLSKRQLEGVRLPYVDEKQLDSLKAQAKGSYVIRRTGNQIVCASVSDRIVSPISGDPYTLTTSQDWGVFRALLENGISDFFSKLYSGRSDIQIQVGHRGLVILAVGDKNDLVRTALADNRAAQEKLNFIKIYRKYYLEAVSSFDPAINDHQFGLVLKISTKWVISASIADLHKWGVDVIGCYALPVNMWQQPGRGDRIVGRISEIRGNQVKLVDYRSDEFVSASQYTIEAKLENIQRCIKILGAQGTKSYSAIRTEIAKLLNAEGQQQRIRDIAGVLGESPIKCSPELSATVDKQALQISSSSRISSSTWNSPGFLLKYGGLPVNQRIASALASQGPFDRDSFQKTTPYVLVITPKQYLGRVDQFLRIWRNGGIGSYQKGVVAQYRLRGCDFYPVDFQETGNVADDYREACIKAIQDMHQKARKYDLAFVVIKESHRLLGQDDPYLIAKASLMGSGIPVQEIEIETIETPENSRPFIMNNLALASYAKMGGTPWVLASPKGQGIMHELVLGVGSSTLSESRVRGQERYVGITTVFDYDGFYQLSTITQETPFQDYPGELRKSLIKSLKTVSAQKGWKNGDRVRIVVHTTNPLKNLEIDVVKDIVEKNLPEYKVDFAFLEISLRHDWMVYDPSSTGLQTPSGSVKGKQVPKRGTFILLNDHDALLSVIGPSELKFSAQGCPEPLHLKLHRASTFNDLVYLSRQVFDFTHMSWKTFNTLSVPVTIEYSNAIARLLGRLRKVKNWNSDILQTSDLSKELWFL